MELEKNYKNQITKTRTYGALVFDIVGDESKNVNRYRNYLDPFSVTDRSAKKTFMPNPFNSMSFTHDYTTLGNAFDSTSKIQTFNYGNAPEGNVITA